MSRGNRINWTEIEEKAGESLENIYTRLKSTRKMADYIKLLTHQSITFNPILDELGRRGIDMRRGGSNNKGRVKDKSGRKCDICGKDPWPNLRRCRFCNPPEDWTDGYGFTL